VTYFFGGVGASLDAGVVADRKAPAKRRADFETRMAQRISKKDKTRAEIGGVRNLCERRFL
jgi:hypothetical protein